jgi:hypothetical protein
VQGAGTLNANVSNSATVNAGDSGKAGLLTITGSYTQLSSGTLTVSVGGTTLGTQYSQLKISGPASLGGTLTAALINKFTPTVGQTFTILTASSVTGTFTNSTIAINSTEQFDISYTSDSVVLTVVSTSGSNSKSQSNETAVADPRQAAGNTLVSAKNSLRRAVGSWIDKRAVVGGVGANGRVQNEITRTDVVPLGSPRIWEHVPVAPSWEHVKAVGAAARAVALGEMHSDPAHHADNWVGVSHAVPVQAPLAGWPGTTNAHRTPMKIWNPAVPMMR